MSEKIIDLQPLFDLPPSLIKKHLLEALSGLVCERLKLIQHTKRAYLEVLVELDEAIDKGTW